MAVPKQAQQDDSERRKNGVGRCCRAALLPLAFPLRADGLQSEAGLDSLDERHQLLASLKPAYGPVVIGCGASFHALDHADGGRIDLPLPWAAPQAKANRCAASARLATQGGQAT